MQLTQISILKKKKSSSKTGYMSIQRFYIIMFQDIREIFIYDYIKGSICLLFAYKKKKKKFEEIYRLNCTIFCVKSVNFTLKFSKKLFRLAVE